MMFTLIMAISMIGNAQNRGYEIVKKNYDDNKGFKNYTVDIKMSLINAKNKTITRALHQKVIETPDDGNKSLLFFNNPADIKGTALLTYSHKTEQDDQWIFLPAIQRVKRISSSSKSGSFMGSEFAFEDLGTQELEKYEYKYLKQEEVDGVLCHVVEKRPLDKNSGYSKIHVYYNKETYRVEQSDYFDKKETLLKSLRFYGYKKYKDEFWRASKLEMKNFKNLKSTTLEFQGFDFETDLDPGQFTSTTFHTSGK